MPYRYVESLGAAVLSKWRKAWIAFFTEEFKPLKTFNIFDVERRVFCGSVNLLGIGSPMMAGLLRQTAINLFYIAIKKVIDIPLSMIVW